MSLVRNLAICSVLLLAASSAEAAIVYGSGASVSGVPPITQTGATTNMNNAPDGSRTIFRNVTSTSAQSVVVTWSFASAPDSIGWNVYRGGSNQNASVTGITLSDGTNSVSTSGISQALPVVSSGQSLVAVLLSNFDSRNDYTVGAVSAFDWTSISSIAVTFTLTNPGAPTNARIQIDAISNPEPTTFALFGLGLLGLAGVVRRRRRVEQAS